MTVPYISSENLLESLEALVDPYAGWLASLSNILSVLYHEIPELNWIGVYFFNGKELVLGPFQGKLACTRIPLHKGVCGAAFSQNKSFLVPWVEDFPGHIACDAASQSEIVIPLHVGGKPWGVLDIDSPQKERFFSQDLELFEAAAKIIEKALTPYWQNGVFNGRLF